MFVVAGGAGSIALCRARCMGQILCGLDLPFIVARIGKNCGILPRMVGGRYRSAADMRDGPHDRLATDGRQDRITVSAKAGPDAANVQRRCPLAHDGRNGRMSCPALCRAGNPCGPVMTGQHPPAKGDDACPILA